MRRLFPIALVGFALSLLGCAGGWRGDVAPGAGTAVAATKPAAAAKPAAASDGVTFTWKGEGGSVALAGEFNGWNTSADPLKKQADGSWTLVKKLEPGRYQYKFVIDGTNWKADPNATETADDGYGGKNSVVVVGGGAAPTTPEAGAAKSATPVASGKGRAPLQTADGVVFTYGGAARSVNLAGDFNGWLLNSDALTQQADGSWTITRRLAPGVYEYKFLVDGTTWKTDEANPDSRADPYGGRNAVVTVK